MHPLLTRVLFSLLLPVLGCAAPAPTTWERLSAKRADLVSYTPASVQSDPDFDGHWSPHFGRQRRPDSHRSRQRCRRRGEACAECVANGLEHIPTVRLDAAPQNCVMPPEGFLHSIAVRIPHARASFDVREEERDSASRVDIHARTRATSAQSYREH